MVPDIESAADVYECVAKFLLISHRHELNHAQIQNPHKRSQHKVPFQRADEEAVKEARPLVQAVARRLLSVENAVFG